MQFVKKRNVWRPVWRQPTRVLWKEWKHVSWGTDATQSSRYQLGLTGGGDPQQSTSQNTDTPAANTALWNRKYTCVNTSNGAAEHELARWSAQLPWRHSKRKKNAHVARCPPIKGWSRWGRSLRLNRWKPNLIFGWRLKLNQKLWERFQMLNQPPSSLQLLLVAS